MSNHGNIKKGLFLLLHISLLCSSLSGVCSKMASRYTDNIFPAVYLLVRAGVRDHVRIRDHLAADIEENASYCGLCQ